MEPVVFALSLTCDSWLKKIPISHSGISNVVSLMNVRLVRVILAVSSAATGFSSIHDLETGAGSDSEDQVRASAFICVPPNPFLYHEDNFCTVSFGSFAQSFPTQSRYASSAGASECDILENVYSNRRYIHAFQTSLSELQPVASPPAPPVFQAGISNNGIPELVPIPCKPCETDRKDRKFIRGSPYKNSMTKLLVDHASGQSGGKILSHPDSLRGVSDIIHSDDGRYMLTACSSKVWFTIKLADEVFIEKVGIVAKELFASTFRHIQILGSRQYPTSEWRVLGEIETNPMENQEWFDLSASGQCSKCYVKYLKFRVLTHHTLEGYTKCALTRVQVFGSTVLQSLDKIQAMSNATEMGTTSKTPSLYVKPPDQLAELFDHKIRTILGNEFRHNLQPAVEVHGSHDTTEPAATPVAPPDENFPLLKFIEEMTSLKKQYASVSSSLNALNEQVRQGTNSTRKDTMKDDKNVSPGSGRYVVSVLGMAFRLPYIPTELFVLILIVAQFLTILVVLNRGLNDNVIHVHPPTKSVSRLHSLRDSRRKPSSVLRPKVRRSISFMHYMNELKRHTDGGLTTPPPPNQEVEIRSPDNEVVDVETLDRT
jgi:hypothetical protein